MLTVVGGSLKLTDRQIHITNMQMRQRLNVYQICETKRQA